MAVKQFTEKPDPATAHSMIKTGTIYGTLVSFYLKQQDDNSF